MHNRGATERQPHEYGMVGRCTRAYKIIKQAYCGPPTRVFWHTKPSSEYDFFH